MDQISASVIVERGPFEMIPHWLLDQPDVSAQAIRLYLLLRRHGNRDGMSFPGRRRLAEQLHASPSTVDRARAELIAAGAMCERQRKATASNEWTSNEYHVHWNQRHDCTRLRPKPSRGPDSYPADEHTSPAYEETSIADGDTPIPPVANELIPIRNLDPLTQTNTPVPASAGPAIESRAAFDAFWNAYPRKVAKQAALKAWKSATRKTPPDVIVAGAIAYAADPNREDQFTAHPATWLNAGRWEDEPLPERGNGKKSGTRVYLEAINELRQPPEPGWAGVLEGR